MIDWQLPPQLEELKFGSGFDQAVDGLRLPDSLRALTFSSCTTILSLDFDCRRAQRLPLF
jgi:hypothetical protein